MRQDQFHMTISGVPNYYAVFKVQKVSTCHDGKLELGDLMYWNDFRSQMVRIKNSMCMQINASHLNFVGYMTVAQMREADK